MTGGDKINVLGFLITPDVEKWPIYWFIYSAIQIVLGCNNTPCMRLYSLYNTILNTMQIVYFRWTSRSDGFRNCNTKTRLTTDMLTNESYKCVSKLCSYNHCRSYSCKIKETGLFYEYLEVNCFLNVYRDALGFWVWTFLEKIESS